MTANELRKKFIDFFVEKGHKEIPSASLIPENDLTTLFISAGMQPLVPYLKGKSHPLGKRLVNSQPSLRFQDIEEVGDSCHTTFFEMLGNWSLGDYFKKDQLSWVLEFFTQELGLVVNNLKFSVFNGDEKFKVPRNGKYQLLTPDVETKSILQNLGISDKNIFFYGSDKNWWSRSGSPEQMLVKEIGGPDCEIFYDFGTPVHNECHPNCNCGRYLEIGNSVFMQYEKIDEKTLKELPHKNVDFGGGLERITAVVNGYKDIFEIDIFKGAKKLLEESDLVNSEKSELSIRIILDHIRAASFLIEAGVVPANKLQGYALRRLIRRAGLYSRNMNIDLRVVLLPIVSEYGKAYSGVYPEINHKKGQIVSIITEELNQFERVLNQGIREIEKAKLNNIDGHQAFDLYATYGLPFEITEELARQKNIFINKEEYEKEIQKHKELSRTSAAGMFKGGLIDHSEIVTKYHTATHLLHAALRQVLGDQVHQVGSNITAERLRFDFTYPEKLTEAEMKQIEDLVNKQIKADLSVKMEIMTLEQAKEKGALAFFEQKYGEQVKVYSVPSFSMEVCGGPHVNSTGEIGGVRIVKEESSGAGKRRIYAKIKV